MLPAADGAAADAADDAAAAADADGTLPLLLPTIMTWDVVYGWRYLYFDVLSMAERQQCLDIFAAMLFCDGFCVIIIIDASVKSLKLKNCRINICSESKRQALPFEKTMTRVLGVITPYHHPPPTTIS